MKMTQAHFDLIKERVEEMDTEGARSQYRSGDFPRADLVQDVNKRYRWDLYWAAARWHGSMPDSTNGYNDAHIYTALRRIVPDL